MPITTSAAIARAAITATTAVLIWTSTASAHATGYNSTSPSATHVTVTGDFDGDQRQDTATLKTTQGTCAITFTYGTGTRAQRTLKPHAKPIPCPNLAISANLGGTQDMLVMSWTSISPLKLANPAAGNQNLIVTDHNLSKVRIAPGIVQPALLGSADFTGDGAGNIWAWSDQSSTMTAFATDLKSPLWRICGDARSNNLHIADTNGDGVQDVVAAATMCDGKMFAATALDGKSGRLSVLADHTTDATSVQVSLTDSTGDGRKNQATVTRPSFDGAPEIITKYAQRDGSWGAKPVVAKSVARKQAVNIRPARTQPQKPTPQVKTAARRSAATAGLMTPQQFAQHFSRP